jgi:hypothetical protein
LSSLDFLYFPDPLSPQLPAKQTVIEIATSNETVSHIHLWMSPYHFIPTFGCDAKKSKNSYGSLFVTSLVLSRSKGRDDDVRSNTLNPKLLVFLSAAVAFRLDAPKFTVVVTEYQSTEAKNMISFLLMVYVM